jgi:hypothetical protein
MHEATRNANYDDDAEAKPSAHAAAGTRLRREQKQFCVIARARARRSPHRQPELREAVRPHDEAGRPDREPPCRNGLDARPSARVEGVARCARDEPHSLFARVGNSNRRPARRGDDQASRPRGDRECGRVAVRARREGEREQRDYDREQECGRPHRATTVNVTDAE